MEYSCKIFNKKINKFLNNQISNVDFKKFYRHLKKCTNCYDALLDEYIFYAIYNDYDKDTNLNYREMLNNKIESKIDDINNEYKKSKRRYIIISILFYFIIAIIIGLLLRNFFV